jgi:hypothetical protein
MTRGERAAIRFVRETLPARVLASFAELGNERYRRVLRACRTDLRLGPDRKDAPRRRVVDAVPAEYRRNVESSLADLVDAELDRRRVAERAAFLIGVAVGQAGRFPSPRSRKNGGAR